MQVSDVTRKVVHSNTIINWSSLGSCVELVLYVEGVNINSSMAQLALRRGWIIEKIPFKLFGTISTLFLVNLFLQFVCQNKKCNFEHFKKKIFPILKSLP